MIFIGSDHAGFEEKERIKKFLIDNGYEVEDCGPLEYDKEDDYPDFALKVAEKVSESGEKGILVCGTGQGVCIAANKVPEIVAALCWDKESAVHAKQHLNANIITFSAKIGCGEEIVKAWLDEKFKEHEERHTRRLSKIKEIEKR